MQTEPLELLLQTQATKFEDGDEISNFPIKLILLKYNSTKIGRNRSVVTANLFKTLQRPVFPLSPQKNCYFKTVSHETASESKINRRSKNFHFGTTAFNKRQRRDGKRVGRWSERRQGGKWKMKGRKREREKKKLYAHTNSLGDTYTNS